ncbi:hypothetical protein JYU34_003153 [Plutella xylostella]|uniref:Uncharacterized protein n=1 Tax=Plutella xylostella TaxID=51655 RepID=A0ABQ7QZC0_PLUXY|nr:hypothetical protein JYU34_003153 [Plutella xylostella]
MALPRANIPVPTYPAVLAQADHNLHANSIHRRSHKEPTVRWRYNASTSPCPVPKRCYHKQSATWLSGAAWWQYTR